MCWINNDKFPGVEYNPKTGELRRVLKGRTRPITCLSEKGYVRVSFQGKAVKGHRLAWAIYHGDWPDGTIDHINGVPDDNRIENLRVVDMQRQARNRKLRKDNKSGAPGVWFETRDKKWRATITVDGKVKTLGLFNELEDAIAVRKEAEMSEEYHNNHGRIGNG